MQRHRPQAGFTLIEMVMVIVIMGVIGGMVAVFMKKPVDAYADAGRRAALTDVADTTARRMARDIRKALPNSILNASSQCIEFIPTKTGGRYRADDSAKLDFTTAATSFNMWGSNSSLSADQRIVAGDLIAVYNLGITGSDAYHADGLGLGNQDNTSVVTALGTETAAPVESPITIKSKLFPLASPGNRFHVISGTENVVAYVCNTATGRLTRTARTFAGATCPATGSALATNVSACNFVYNGSDLQRNGLVQLSLSFTSNGETVSLYHEVQVDNTP